MFINRKFTYCVRFFFSNTKTTQLFTYFNIYLENTIDEKMSISSKHFYLSCIVNNNNILYGLFSKEYPVIDLSEVKVEKSDKITAKGYIKFDFVKCSSQQLRYRVMCDFYETLNIGDIDYSMTKYINCGGESINMETEDLSKEYFVCVLVNVENKDDYSLSYCKSGSDSNDNDSNTLTYIFSSIAGVILLTVIIVAIICYIKKCRENKERPKSAYDGYTNFI